MGDSLSYLDNLLPQMQTYDYARTALWDAAIKFSLQSRVMTSPDHLEIVVVVFRQ